MNSNKTGKMVMNTNFKAKNALSDYIKPTVETQHILEVRNKYLHCRAIRALYG